MTTTAAIHFRQQNKTKISNKISNETKKQSHLVCTESFNIHYYFEYSIPLQDRAKNPPLPTSFANGSVGRLYSVLLLACLSNQCEFDNTLLWKLAF